MLLADGFRFHKYSSAKPQAARVSNQLLMKHLINCYLTMVEMDVNRLAFR
jgi:hypothetical protein